MSESPPARSWGFGVIVLFIILPLIFGSVLTLLIPQPIIGTIRLGDAIDADSAKDVIAQIIYARNHSEVRAVVLILDSPGGTVTHTEAVYMELAALRKAKPIVTVVEGMAASGAYYIAVNTDYIFATPSSIIGNIGVITTLPPTPVIDENVYSTGPYKLWGSPRDETFRKMEMLKQGFFNAVKLGRRSALKLSDDVILSGQIWSGSDAVRVGLIDELGSQGSAIEKAASIALIRNYQVESLHKLAGLPTPSQVVFPLFGSQQTPQPASVQNSAYPKEPGIYYLYIPMMESKP